MKILILLLSVISISTFASDLIVENSRIKMSPPGAPATAMYLTIKNKSNKDVYLVKVESDLSSEIEIHEMKMENGKMEMRQISKLLISKDSSLELKAGGLHIMLFELTKSLKENDSHKFKLFFDNKEQIEITAVVK
jgi:copper(I)-binding protein